MRYIVILMLGCGDAVAESADDAGPAPTCAPIEAGPCHDGWSTLRFVECQPGARPADEACVQDDYDGSPYWCCP